MTKLGFEESFLRQNAGKHFVALTYRLRRDDTSLIDQTSCFLIELHGVWFLLTAGHWMKDGERGLERLLADGYRIENIQLVDAFAGHSGSPLPFTFEPNDWVAIYNDVEGLDYAALPIRSFYRRGLEAAGVKPIELHAMAPADFVEGSALAMAGVPAETRKEIGTSMEMSLVLMPLREYTGTDFAVKGNSILAYLPPLAEVGAAHRIANIAGMSGCPVFRLTTAVVPKKYWLIGMQSGWYEASRVVRFCPTEIFIGALEEAIRDLREEFEKQCLPDNP